MRKVIWKYTSFRLFWVNAQIQDIMKCKLGNENAIEIQALQNLGVKD